ncbi:30S ribosomal protein S13 [Candidatus Shapirobacteria bacterium]|nr:30S ribosomal protein S13 [Candidatus Shapirobacteria bacterium]
MARIAGVDLPKEKRLDIGLTLIYGVGRRNVGEILAKANIDPAKRIAQLTDEEVAKINKAMEDFMVEGDLRKKISTDIQRLKSIGAYRGLRHTKGLPVRGQRTRSNARTKRGKRKTIGAMKKEVLSKFGKDKETTQE